MRTSRAGVAAVTAALAMAVGLAGPTTASAQEECQTIEQCVLERVGATVGQLEAELLATVEAVKQEVAELQADALARATAGARVCTLRGRVDVVTHTAAGSASCVMKSRGTDPLAGGVVHSGTFTASNVTVEPTATGPKLRFDGNPALVINADDGTSTVTSLDSTGTAGVTAHKGTYAGYGPAFTAAAVFHTMYIGLITDPPSDDYLINGVVVMEGLA
ncbi:MAG TPA: hypothetical protein VF529_10860 [Solirubrobacteraceae bacterium]|jgi:hypothetical protein